MELNEFNTELEQAEAELKWLEDMTMLQKELDVLEEHDRELSRREEGFESERRRLTRAQRALEFGADYASLVSLRKEQESDKRAHLDIQLKLPNMEAGVRRADEALQFAVTAYLEKQSEQKTTLELIHKVRDLDLKQKEKETPIFDCLSAIKELTDSLREQRAKLEENQLTLENMQVQMRDIQKFLQRNSVDEWLLEQLAGIRARFDALAAALQKRTRLNDERARIEKQKQDTQTFLDDQSALYETVKTKFTSLDGAIRKLRAARDETLGAKGLSEWKNDLAAIEIRRSRIEDVENTLKIRAECLEERQKIKERTAVIELLRREKAQKLAKQKYDTDAFEKEKRNLDIQTELLRRIKELESARHSLKEGEPCPLCGSVSHPYVEGDIPGDDEVRSALLHAEEDLKNARAQEREVSDEVSALDREIISLGEEDSELRTRVHALESRLAEKISELELTISTNEDPMTAIRSRKQKTEDALQKTRIAVERADKIDKELRTAQEDLESVRNERDNLARSQQEMEFTKESVLLEWKRVNQDIHVHGEDLRNIRMDLIHQISPLGFRNLPDEQPEHVLLALEERSQKWQELHRKRLELEKQMAIQESALHQARSSFDSMNLELKDKNDALKKLKSEKEALRQQRVSLFEDKNPDEEEVARNRAVSEAMRQADTKREKRDLVLKEFNGMTSRLDDLGRSIHIRSDSLQKMNISFGRRLIAGDFKNEDAYLSSCLSEPERKALQEHAGVLVAERAELDAKRSDTKFALEELRRKKPAGNSPNPTDLIESLYIARAKRDRLKSSAENAKITDERAI
ncbi:hypothetical protein AGMMS49957_05990 [Synergistales bacterium]|nr:hypothetical protein AGMMS49957_05990 [Synergistales bacterium]